MEWKLRKVNSIAKCRRCFHAAAIVDEKVYLHGGLQKYKCDNLPLNDILMFDPINSNLSVIKSKNNGPARSHHKAIGLNKQTLCIIGGWNGKKRTSDVWLFDTIDLCWTLCEMDSRSLLPAGLSSHTCTLLGSNEVIVTGREGGIHTQRRYGSVFKLKINISKKTCMYNELTHHISSRAGHSCCGLSMTMDSREASLVVVGGRDSTNVDHLPITSHPDNKDLAHLLHKTIKTDKASPVKPYAIRHHTTLPAADLALIQGGEVFGKTRGNIIADFFIHNHLATKWWRVLLHGNEASLIRMGHTTAWVNGCIYIFGGVGQAGMVESIVEIQLKDS